MKETVRGAHAWRRPARDGLFRSLPESAQAFPRLAAFMDAVERRRKLNVHVWQYPRPTPLCLSLPKHKCTSTHLSLSLCLSLPLHPLLPFPISSTRMNDLSLAEAFYSAILAEVVKPLALSNGAGQRCWYQQVRTSMNPVRAGHHCRRGAVPTSPLSPPSPTPLSPCRKAIPAARRRDLGREKKICCRSIPFACCASRCRNRP